MAKRQMKLTFPSEMITEPVVFNLGRDFRIVTSIRRADIAGEWGWVVLDLDGSDEDIERGLAWVTAKGVGVETVDGEL